MAKPKVFVTRMIDQEALEMIAGEAEMELWPDEGPPSPETLREKVREAEGVLTNVMDRVDGALLDAASRLKVVSQLAVGVDNIDVPELTRRGIPLGHTPGVLSKATADLTFALLLAAARQVAQSDRGIRAGHWKMAFHPTHWVGADVSEATIGIVGMGKIGREVARRALGFEMKVLFAEVFPVQIEEEAGKMEQVDLPTLLRDSDFVTLHVPLLPDTRHLIGERELATMKPTSILVNASRGPVVDSKALYRALKERSIAGAALDVFDPEPVRPDDPILTLDNVVMTPHIGSASVGSRRGMGLLAARNLLAGLKGERLAVCFNSEVYGAG